MGLDIFVRSNVSKELMRTTAYLERKLERTYGQELSRVFCVLISRSEMDDETSVLYQISRIVGLDISLLFRLADYPTEESVQFELKFFPKSEKEEGIYLKKKEEKRRSYLGNLDSIYDLLIQFISRLDEIDDIYSQINADDCGGRLNFELYFSNFKDDVNTGHCENNFGQDLRNLKKELEYYKSQGANTIWFDFG